MLVYLYVRRVASTSELMRIKGGNHMQILTDSSTLLTISIRVLYLAYVK
jgi:hypothetical protein